MSTVAIQGVCGSYSEEAAKRLCGQEAQILECLDFAAAFETLQTGKAELAVVPLKNKIVGEIESAAKIFGQTAFRVLDELQMEIRHALVGTPEAAFESLKSVRSHPEALKQCRRFLSENPNLETIVGADTALSVREIIEENNAGQAAIASRRAAEIYGGRVLRENIADDPDNWTLFYLIGK